MKTALAFAGSALAFLVIVLVATSWKPARRPDTSSQRTIDAGQADASTDARADTGPILDQELVAKYRAMGPAGRLKETREMCDAAYVSDEMLAAATDGNEVWTLRNACVATRMVSRQKEDVELRKSFADAYDDELLSKHMNPDGVRAIGRTLHVDGWFCSRQFIFDFTRSDAGRAKSIGFNRVECSSGYAFYGQDL